MNPSPHPALAKDMSRQQQQQTAVLQKELKAYGASVLAAHNAETSRQPVLTITIEKDADIAVTGITFCKNQNGRLMVAAMTQTCDLPKYGVYVGMEMIAINNCDTTTLSETGAAILMQAAELLTFLVPHSSVSKEYAPGKFITAIIHKAAASDMVGVALSQLDPGVDTGHVTIRELYPNTLIADTGLTVGMQLISVNNVICMNSKETANWLRHKTGTITLLAQVPAKGHVVQATTHIVTSTVTAQVIVQHKQKHGNPGLVLAEVDADETHKKNAKKSVMITHIDPNGPFGQSELLVGMELVTINNLSCETLGLASTLLVKCHVDRLVTVVAQLTCRKPPGTVVVATCLKDTVQSKVGIMMGMDYAAKGNQVVCKFVTRGGLLSRVTKTEANGKTSPIIEPGMIIHKVNNVAVTGKLHNKEVSALLQNAERTVTFLAEAPTSQGASCMPPSVLAALCTATMTKKLNDQNVGLKLSKNNGGRIVITHLEDGGLAATCGLRRGMTLVSINYVNLADQYMSIDDVMALINNHPAAVPMTLLLQSTMIQPVVSGTIFKETKQSLVGIRLRKHKEAVAIINITEGSVTSSTDLLGGMMIKAINNTSVEEKTCEDVANMLADAQGYITILGMYCTNIHELVVNWNGIFSCSILFGFAFF